MLSLQQALQDLTEKLWAKIKDKFIAKEDVINGVVLDPQWDILDTVQNNTSITLPSLDTFDEIYIVMDNGESTVIHQTAIKKESLLSDNENVTYREILLDTLYDAETYVTYYPDTNTIVPSICEGISIDEESDITTTIYTKKYSIVDGTKIAANLLSYDDTTTELGANNVQDAIVKLDEKVDNIPSGENGADGQDGKSAYEYAQEGGYNGTEAEFTEALGDIGDIGITLTTTLPSGQSSLTLTDERITTDSTLNAVYTSKFGMSVKSAVFEEGSLTIEFPSQDEDVDIKVVINANLALGGNGIGIESIEQTVTSTEDNGDNVITVTMTDGSSETFTIKNGSQGSQGEKGETGEQGIQGEQGVQGKSAYDYAVDGGYQGTEEEFASLFGNINNILNDINDELDTKAVITSGTTDLTAGTSELANGVIYCVYE